MNSLKKHTLFLFFIFSIFCTSQTSKKKEPLVSVLKQIETRYNIKISYADDTVNKVYIVSPRPNLTLSETLDYLSEKTGLRFNILSKRFIAIEKPKASPIKQFQIQQLDAIYIRNYLTSGISKSNYGAIEISPQTFGILPGLSEPDILQTIQTLPSITSADERISNINIRGGTNDQNLVLYEGIRMYQTGHFFGLISAFNPYLMDNVNVTINGTRAKYGSGVSSVIEIKNSDNIEKESSSGAGFNLLSFDGFSKFQLSKKLQLQVSARRSYTDALLTPTYDNYFERIFKTSQLNENQTEESQLQRNENFFFYDTSLKFLYDISENSKIRANIIAIFNELNYNFNPENTSDFATKSQLSQQSYAGNIAYQHQFKNALQLNTQLYFSNYQLFGENNVVATGQQLTQENEVSDFGLRADVLTSLKNTITINFGYQFNNIGVSNLENVSNPNFSSFVREFIATHGVYSEAEFISKSKKTRGRIGLRGNYISDFNNILVEPRLSFSQKFLDDFRLEILGEIKSQTISQIIDLQQDFFGIEKRRWQLSNDMDVPIIKSNQISTGLSYKKSGFLINAEAYIKNVNGITTRSQGFQNQYQFINATGDYTVKGVDVLFNKQFKNFSTWLSYSFSDNDYKFDGLNNNQPFANNIDIRHVVNISTAYTMNDLKLSAGFNWRSGKPFTEPSEAQLNSGTLIYEDPNDKRLEDYMRLDISARYAFDVADHVKGEVGASVWNLLDQRNIVNRFFTRDGDDPIIQSDEIALGLTPNFSFRIKF